MGKFSEITEETAPTAECPRLSINIEILPHLRDHVFGKKAVFPAVESMQLLARAVGQLRAGLDERLLSQTVFEKFLVLDPRENSIEARVEFEKIREGGISAGLVTRQRLAGSGITRVKEHARVLFTPRSPTPATPETPTAPDLPESETDLAVAPEIIYRELVPFGPSYQNIASRVRLNRTAATAAIHAPEITHAEGPLGSPFVLDAAFHAACVWGQRYSGFIGFPVGFDSRTVLKPTLSGETYRVRLTPRTQGHNENTFDLWIYQPENGIFEVVKGLKMRDVTGGRTRPPEWIQEIR